MPLIYSPASRTLQDTFDTRRLADRLVEVKVHERFTDSDRQFIGTGGGNAHLSELSALHPHISARAALSVRATTRCTNAGAGVEAVRLGD